MTFQNCLPLGGVEPTGPPWRGALCIQGAYALGPRPGNPTNVFFLDEMDVVEDDLAAQILHDYRDVRGYNAAAAGPAYAKGYRGFWPDTDWRQTDPQIYAAHLASRYAGLHIRYFALPDEAPYWLGERDGWDLDAVERDFGAIFDAIAPIVGDVVIAWEPPPNTPSAVFQAAVAYLHRKFPGKEIYYHNPPGHDGPGRGDEENSHGELFRVLGPLGLTGHLLQVTPPHEGGTVEGLKYDAWDLMRRFQGIDGSPWGGPIYAFDGKPMREEAFEYCAASMTNGNPPLPEAVAVEWGTQVLTVPNVTCTGDGGPPLKEA